MQISYTKKAPAFANIDNIEAKFTDHYGKIWTDAALFQKEVLDEEKSNEKIGDSVSNINLSDDREFEIRKVGINSQNDFSDKQFYLQCALSFFIDGAS